VKKKNHLPLIFEAPWALQPESYEQLCRLAQVVQQNPTAFDLGEEAVEPLDDRLDVRRGVAVIPVHGVLRRGGVPSFFSPYFAARRYEMIRELFVVALESRDVEAIVFDIDSPGGEVTGCDDLARTIFEARGRKSIQAVATGTMASAAYWIGSAVDRIYCSRTSMIGSIGICCTYIDWSKYDERIGIREIQIVSSQSPDKNLDPTTRRGRESVQTRVDQLAGVFIADIARNRGVSEATVLADFGRGDVLVGEFAIEAGLADEIGTLESVVDAIHGAAPQPGFAPTREDAMADQTVNVNQITPEWLRAHCPTVAKTIEDTAREQAKSASAQEVEKAKAEARADGATAERARLIGIEQAFEGFDYPDLMAKCKEDAETTPEKAAAEILAAERAGKTKHTEGRKADEKKASGVADLPPAADDDDDSPAAQQRRGAADAKALREAGLDF